MNKPLRNMTALAIMLALGTLVSAHRAAAADSKPALTIAFAGYDQLISDLKALDELSGHTKLAAQAEANIELRTKGKGLAGLDKSRPWGVLVSLSDDGQPVVQGFLPVTDLKQLLASIPAPGGDTPAPNDKGVYEYPMGDKTVYVKQKGKWAVFSENEDALGSTPADPTEAFTDLTKKYLLSVRGSVQNVPEATRANALKSLRGLVEITLAMQPGSDDSRALLNANVKQAFEKLDVLSKELDTLVIGVGFDSSSKALFLDFEAKGVDGSNLAKKFENLKDAKTDFAGFAVEGSAMTIQASGTSDDEDVQAAKAALANYKKSATKALDDNEALGDKRELAKKLLDDLLDVVEKTVELKKSDFGMSLVLSDTPVVIAGLRIAEGVKLDGAIKKLVKELSADEPKLADMIKLDAEEYEGVKFHVAKIPVNDEKAAAIFGDSVQIVIGTSESALYFGAGKDPIEAIKKAMDASKASPGKEINSFDLVISGTPIAKFFAKVIPAESPSDAKAKKNFTKAAAILAKSDGKDHITMTTKAIPNGGTLRLNVESGVIKAILDLMPGSSSADSDDN